MKRRKPVRRRGVTLPGQSDDDSHTGSSSSMERPPETGEGKPGAVSEPDDADTGNVASMEFRPTISLTQAMRDVSLLGGPFKARSFWPWFVVAKLSDGLLLDDRELELFKQCTGRTTLPLGPVRRLIILVGRRGGKDRFFSALAI
jgi:hypothetical protein